MGNNLLLASVAVATLVWQSCLAAPAMGAVLIEVASLTRLMYMVLRYWTLKSSEEMFGLAAIQIGGVGHVPPPFYLGFATCAAQVCDSDVIFRQCNQARRSFWLK